MRPASQLRPHARCNVRGSARACAHSRGQVQQHRPGAAVAGASHVQRTNMYMQQPAGSCRGAEPVYAIYRSGSAHGAGRVPAHSTGNGSSATTATTTASSATEQQPPQEQPAAASEQPPPLDAAQQEQHRQQQLLQQEQWEAEMEETLKLVHLLPESGACVQMCNNSCGWGPQAVSQASCRAGTGVAQPAGPAHAAPPTLPRALPRLTSARHHLNTEHLAQPPIANTKAVRTALESHAQLYELLEVVMDLGRPPLARFPTGDVRLAEEPVSAEDLEQAVAKV